MTDNIKMRPMDTLVLVSSMAPITRAIEMGAPVVILPITTAKVLFDTITSTWWNVYQEGGGFTDPFRIQNIRNIFRRNIASLPWPVEGSTDDDT